MMRQKPGLCTATIITPDEAAGMLACIYGQAADIEALLRYHRTSANAPANKTFWMTVLEILDAQTLRDVRITPQNIASLLRDNAKRYTFIVSYIHEAGLEEDIVQVKFWLQVMDVLNEE